MMQVRVIIDITADDKEGRYSPSTIARSEMTRTNLADWAEAVEVARQYVANATVWAPFIYTDGTTAQKSKAIEP